MYICVVSIVHHLKVEFQIASMLPHGMGSAGVINFVLFRCFTFILAPKSSVLRVVFKKFLHFNFSRPPLKVKLYTLGSIKKQTY